jgi:ABC-type Fe3+/spermidine/putrescine transport system ATPase subunit
VDGQLLRLGSPAELIADPGDAFVARFTGASVLPGTAVPDGAGGARIVLDVGAEVRSARHAAGRVGVAVYPWEARLDGSRDGMVTVSDRVCAATPEGSRARVRLSTLTAEVPVGSVPSIGSRVDVGIPARDARVVTL